VLLKPHVVPKLVAQQMLLSKPKRLPTRLHKHLVKLVKLLNKLPKPNVFKYNI
jgi:hypothetical protein